MISDPRSKPFKRVQTCYYCKDHTHLISKDNYVNDSYAKEDPPNSGKWKCGNCLDRELEDVILEYSPNSDRARQIIVKRQRELDDKLRKHEYLERIKRHQSNSEIFKKSKGVRVRR
ncbi:hypothetical protein BH18THE2_BH18THE2_40330 [soil metagenome]